MMHQEPESVRLDSAMIRVPLELMKATLISKKEFDESALFIKYLEGLSERLFGSITAEEFVETAKDFAVEILSGTDTQTEKEFKGSLKKGSQLNLEGCLSLLSLLSSGFLPEAFAHEVSELLPKFGIGTKALDLSKAAPPNDEELRKLIKYSGLDAAREIIGDANDAAYSLGTLLHLQNLGAEDAALEEVDDTHSKISFGDYLRIAHEEGFSTVLADSYVLKRREDTDFYCILWREDGVLLVLSSYEKSRVNSAMLYFNYEPHDLSESFDLHDVTGSISSWAGLVKLGRSDVRRGLRLNLRTLSLHGKFLSPWVKDPDLYLLTRKEEEGLREKGDQLESIDFYEQERIKRLPEHIQKAIIVKPDTEFRSTRSDYEEIIFDHGFEKLKEDTAYFSSWNKDRGEYPTKIALYGSRTGLLLATAYQEQENGSKEVMESRLYFSVAKENMPSLGPLAYRLEAENEKGAVYSLPAGIGIRYKLGRLLASNLVSPNWFCEVDKIGCFPYLEDSSFRGNFEEKAIETATRLFKDLPAEFKKIFGQS